MSVVKRTMQGVDYIHVRRKVNGEQKQVFINVNGLSDKEIALARYKAKKLDTVWKNEQPSSDDSLMSLFAKSGVLKHIKVKVPTKKSGWSVVSSLHANENRPAFHVSRSIFQNGIDSAASEVFELLVRHLGFNENSINMKVLKSVYIESLKMEYDFKKAQWEKKLN